MIGLDDLDVLLQPKWLYDSKWKALLFCLLRYLSPRFTLGFCGIYFISPNIYVLTLRFYNRLGERRAEQGSSRNEYKNTRLCKSPALRQKLLFLHSSNNSNHRNQNIRVPFCFVDTGYSWEYNPWSRKQFPHLLEMQRTDLFAVWSIEPSNPGGGFVGADGLFPQHRRIKGRRTSGWHSSPQSHGCSRRSINSTPFTSSSGIEGSGSLVSTSMEADGNCNDSGFCCLHTHPREELILWVLWKLRSEGNIRSSVLITSQLDGSNSG